MHYRLYSPGDFEALYAIEERCFEPQFRFSRGYLRALFHGSKTATWVAEAGESVAGFAVVEWSGQAEGPLAYLQTIEVAPEFRRRGVGGELLEHCEASARAAGACQIWLHVDEQNASALRLYQANGYLRRGRKENYYPQGRAALVLCKPCPPDQAR